MAASPGFTLITATKLLNGAGQPLNGFARFTPASSQGNVVSLQARTSIGIAGGSPVYAPAGTISAEQVSFYVVNGSITTDLLGNQAQLVDCSLCLPLNAGFQVQLVDSSTGQNVQGPGYGFIQPSGATWSFDNLVPNQPALITTVVGAQGPQGPPGPISYSQLSTALQEVTGISSVAITPSPNVFDYTAVTSNVALQSDGTLSSLTGYTVSDFMVCPSTMTSFECNGKVGFFVPAAPPNFGVVYYNASKQVIGYDITNADNGSTQANDTAANVVHHVPALSGTLGFFRVYFQDGIQPVAYSALMVVVGNNGVAPAMPSTYVSFASVVTGGPGSNPLVRLATMNAAISLATTGPVNLLNPATLTANAAISYPGGPPYSENPPQLVSGTAGFTRTAPMPVSDMASVASNIALHCHGGYGPAFTDASGNFLTLVGDLLAFAQAGIGIPAGTSLQVPSGAAFFLCYANVSAASSGDDGPQSISAWMVCASITATVTLPSSFLPYGASSGGSSGGDATARAAAAAAQTTANTALAAARPLAGVKVSMLGDSITYGQGSGLFLPPLVAAITGHTDTGSLAWSGRAMWDALNNTGNTAVAFPSAASIAALGANGICIVWLGTNLSGAADGTIGSPSDTASVGASNANGIAFPNTDSYCAQCKGVYNQLLAWNPQLRIIKVAPYQSANQNAQTGGTHYAAGVAPSAAGLALLKAVYTADLAVAGDQYGIPVLNAFGEMGICAANINTLTVDSVHPTAATQQTRVAPFIAHKITQYAAQ